MEYQGYSAKIEYDESLGAFHGQVLLHHHEGAHGLLAWHERSSNSSNHSRSSRHRRRPATSRWKSSSVFVSTSV